MQSRPAIGTLAGTLLVTGSVLGVLGWHFPEWQGALAEHDRQTVVWLAMAVALFILMIAAVGYRLLKRDGGRSGYAQLVADDVPELVPVDDPQPRSDPSGQARSYLREHHGRFWRRKLRLLLIVGEPEQIKAIAPGLAEQRWQVGQGVVLLWGGDLHAETAPSLFDPWRGLSRWRPLDGVVWALSTAQSRDATSIRNGARHLRQLARDLHGALPLHLWQVCDSEWPQTGRPTPPVGTLLSARFNAAQLQAGLEDLLVPLRREGMGQMREVMDHDFLFRLASDLETEGLARWGQVLVPWFGELARSVPLRGLWFSLPLSRAAHEGAHVWPPTPVWQGIVDDRPAAVRRLGWPVTRIVPVALLVLAVLWGAGLLLSFTTHRAQVAQLHTVLAALKEPGDADGQLRVLHELARELSRLDYRAEHGVPWYQRFGLDQNAALLARLWPHYVDANQPLIRHPAAAGLEARLRALVQLPPDSPERLRQAEAGYRYLKAYLMMARPERADADFLARTLDSLEPVRKGLSPGLWQGLSPNLWRFYAEHLPAHPEWRIEADPLLVMQVRQILLGQLGQRNAETSLYRQVLEQVAPHAPDLSLQQMLGETHGLFSTTASVPGVFTRQAWEGQVRPAIDRVAQARREEVDWVLSEKPVDIDPALSPERLKAHLTERYFHEYAGAWLDFLDSLRWHRADSLGEAIEQLSLMSDARQSPLIALMNTLAYQGQAGGQRQALGDSLLQSAQQWVVDCPQKVGQF